MAGAAFAWLEGRLRQRWQRLALLGLCLAAIAPTALANTARYRRAFLYPMPEVDRAEQFHQVKLSNIYLREQSAEGYGNTYLNVLRGVGSVIWDSNIKMSENALPRYLVDDVGIRSPNILYRGEAWFAEPGNQVGRISITPNRIEVAVDLKSPGLLTINQNYDPSWKVEGGELLRKEGLLQVRCKAGRRTVMLHYSPPCLL